MKNTIVDRVYDFLRKYPPFDLIDERQLFEVASNVEVLYYEKDRLIFEQGSMPRSYFYIVKEGAVGLHRRVENDTLLLDICDEGDVFGLRPLIQDDNYLMSAITQEESILYSISVAALKAISLSNHKVHSFLLASFSTNIKTPYANTESVRMFENQTELAQSAQYFDLQPAEYSRNPITCNALTSITEAASLMTAHNIGSLIVEEASKPIGIITDKDLRVKIATGLVSIKEKVSKIMSSPVITTPENLTVAEAQLLMVKHNITHLCITKDGSVFSDIAGILSEHDLIAVRSNNPSVLLKKVRRATTTEDLKLVRDKVDRLLALYIAQGSPIEFIGGIISEINDTIIHKAVTISIAEMPSAPPSEFAWLALGSQGRKEQLLMTDQDNALVFADVSEEKYIETKNYFLELAKKVTEKLNVIGFEYCPADMMASNPNWCLSLTEWKQQFRRWITTPTQDAIMMCTIFFDFTLVYGNMHLVTELSRSIFSSIDSFEIFLNHLARNAVQNPAPIGFFRQFIVESDGAHKNQFDLKARALMPLIDAARLLTLSHKLIGKNNTIERYKALMALEPQNNELYESCIDALKLLIHYRTEQGLKNKDIGRYIALDTLNKVQKLTLKACFKPIKEIQELLHTRYQLSQLL